VLLVWVYYSAQIFLLGAEFTWVYAHRHGSRARTTPSSAVAIPQRSRQAASESELLSHPASSARKPEIPIDENLRFDAPLVAVIHQFAGPRMILADRPDGLTRARLTPDRRLVIGCVERLVVAHADRIPAGVTDEDKGRTFRANCTTR
jgi:hypothetical protein